ncbi:MAG: FAD-binding oxidoreductase [Rubrobacter sp.]|nr:FAD-binding oxidoreductase [Rubrobacter sp.]
MRALEPLAVGCYVSEADIAANPSQVVNSYARSNWERLQALREKYDPNGVLLIYGRTVIEQEILDLEYRWAD